MSSLPLYDFFEASFHNDFPERQFNMEIYALYMSWSMLFAFIYLTLFLVALQKFYYFLKRKL